METAANKYNDQYLEIAHQSSFSHKAEIMTADLCGCFYCEQTFSPNEIEEWVVENIGETAICPKCGVDAVLSSTLPITDQLFLEKMNKYWFKFS
ncbi:MAG: hypothetical protein EOO47_17300 [Flavobacterium sp.]|nr:MAG: hypothetical protein EOO47_17300 [Flavobacterium sp.]